MAPASNHKSKIVNHNFSVVLWLFVLLWSIAAMAAPKAPKADQVMTEAKAKATAQHKAIFLIFGASWCPECHTFDRFLALPEVNAIFDKYFVVSHLDVFEAAGAGNKKLENSGGDQFLLEFGGISSKGEGGFPFFVVLDEKAAPLINSNRPAKGKAEGDGIGFPAQPQEIAWFLTMLKRGAPSLTDEEAKVIQGKLLAAE
ncbi:MAG TPA: thioredoxin family protein [Candidatus Angelobacter sp.]